MQRRLNKKLSENLRTPTNATRDTTTRRKPNKLGPPTGSEAALKGTRRRRTPSKTEELLDPPDAEANVPDDIPDDGDGDEPELDEDADDLDDQESPPRRSSSKVGPGPGGGNNLVFPQSPQLLPLDDQEFEDEFGPELLEKAFTDSIRGSQRDLPVRSSSKVKGVEVQFVNERMAAFLPGVKSRSNQGSLSPSKRQLAPAPSKTSRKSKANSSRTPSTQKTVRSSSKPFIAPRKSMSRRELSKVSKGFVVNEEEQQQEVGREWKWSRNQNGEDAKILEEGPSDYYVDLEADNIYEMEEEILVKSDSGRRKSDNYVYPFAVLDMEEKPGDQDDEGDEDDYEDMEEEIVELPSPPPRQRTKSSLRRGSSRTSLRGNEGTGGRIMDGNDSLNMGSSSLLIAESRTRIGGGSDRGSNSSLRASSRDNIGSRSRTRSAKFNDEEEDDMLGAVSALPNDINVGYARSNVRLGDSRYDSRGQLGRPRSSYSREVTPLPIEIPDSVSDEAAFRRYLSVRRGATITTRPLLPFAESKSYSSVGEGGPARLPPAMTGGRSSTNSNAHARLDTNRKTSCLCFAIVSLALLSASASQLRYVVAYSKAHAYPGLNYFLICFSIIIEVVAGIGYIIVSRFPPSDPRIDNIIGILIAGLFVVAINNVIISAFAFDDHVCEVLAKQTGMLDVVDQTPNEN